MVAVAGKIADGHLGIRDTPLDQTLDLARSHSHGILSRAFRASGPPYRLGASPRSARAALPPEWGARLRDRPAGARPLRARRFRADRATVQASPRCRR